MLRSELVDKGYTYGFILDGKKYKPNMNAGFDEAYYELLKTIYRVQDPIITMKEQIGTCVEAVLVMRKMLEAHMIPNKIWLLYNIKKNRVHTVLTFEAEHQVVHLELTPQCTKPAYGQPIIYSDEAAFLAQYQQDQYDVSDVTHRIVVGERPSFLLEKFQD